MQPPPPRTFPVARGCSALVSIDIGLITMITSLGNNVSLDNPRGNKTLIMFDTIRLRKFVFPPSKISLKCQPDICPVTNIISNSKLDFVTSNE